jgi:hypothetical protein
MKQLKVVIKSAEIQPEKDGHKESYKIVFQDDKFLYCYNKDIFNHLDKCFGKEVDLELSEPKEGKTYGYIQGVVGLELKKPEKKGFNRPFVPKDMTEKEIRTEALKNSIMFGENEVENIIETADRFVKYITTGK